MMRIRQLFLFGFLLAACSWLATESAQAQQIRWRHDYASALREAKEKGLPLVIDFYMIPCVWCDRLNDDVFQLPHVSKVMNEQFIPLKINGTQERQLANALQIQSYPTVILADSDGKILGTIEGYQKAPRFLENLQRALARVDNPEWMVRDYLAANKALGNPPDYGKSISLLQHILEDGKTRPIQRKAKKLLDQIEEQAAQQFARARQFNTDGKTTEAMKELSNLVQTYPGTQSATEAGQMLSGLAKQPVSVKKERTQVAKELLGEAKEYYRKENHLECLDVCQKLIDKFGDLPAADKAREMRLSIQTNTAWLEKSCDELSQKMTNMLLLLAEAQLKKGDRQRAMETYQRIINNFPGTRHSEIAAIHLRQLRGEPTVPVDFQNNRKQP